MRAVPKGRVEPRECICRACGGTFVSDRPRAWYCHGPECPQTPNLAPMQTAEERERARAQAQADAWERQRSRDEQRAIKQRERDAAAAQRDIDRLLPQARQRREMLEQTASALNVARERLRIAQGKPPAPVLPAPPAVVERQTDEVIPDQVREVFAEARRTAFRLSREGVGGRLGLKRAVTRVATAQGVAPLHEALDGLIAAAIAWKMGLPLPRAERDADAA